VNPKLGGGAEYIQQAQGIRRHVKRRNPGPPQQATLGQSGGRLTGAGLRSLPTQFNNAMNSPDADVTCSTADPP
jgi:hypothetical protein